jgi:hypothetical protein
MLQIEGRDQGTICNRELFNYKPFDMVSKPAQENLETPSTPVTLRTRGEPELPKVKQLSIFLHLVFVKKNKSHCKDKMPKI